MKRNPIIIWYLLGALYFGALATKVWSKDSAAIGGTIRVHSGAVVDVPEATFFPFDDRSVPFRRNLRLTMVAPDKHPTSVLPRGPEGSFDELRAEYYGAVIKIDGTFRMWYVGYGFADANDRSLRGVVASVGYAESADGIRWTKPNLGLVSFRGSKANNIVAIEPEDLTHPHADRNVHVLYEPQDPDPARRYKMMLMAPYSGARWRGRWTMIHLLSADGLHWRYATPLKLVIEADPTKPKIDRNTMPFPPEHLEGGSLINLGGVYYHNGQQHNRPDGTFTGRMMGTFWSPDFIHWHPEKAISFVRGGYDFATPVGEGNEVHEGAALWNRGNVLVGIYGRWQGAKKARDLVLDLGVISSVDAIHFTEPDPKFVFVTRGKPGAWDSGGMLQGQGFENVGDKTYIWYGSWNLAVSGDKIDLAVDMLTSHGEVGLLTLRRDGFGYFSVLDPREAKPHETYESGTGSLMTAAFTVKGLGAEVFLNVDSPGPDGLTVQLLDEGGMPVAGYGHDDFSGLGGSGLRQKAMWGQRQKIPSGGPYRLRVALKHHENAPKLYALYVAAQP